MHPDSKWQKFSMAIILFQNNTSGVVDEVTQIENRAMDGFSCRQQWVGVFPSLCHMGKNGILMQQTGSMFDSAETNAIVEYYGHLPSVVFCICMILPYLRAQSSKDLLREPALHPHGSCLHDSPQLTKQVPIRLVNNQSPMSCIFGVVVDFPHADNSITKTSV